MADIAGTENDNSPGAENPSGTGKEVIFLEPGDEQAQKIAKAMGSQMAGDILQLLKSGPKTSTEVTSTLNIPMGTAKYHIENLLDAGLIEVTKTKYSVKGREIKVYGLKDQLLIVTPRITNVRSLLLKYASLFGVVIIATAVTGAILGLLSQESAKQSVSRGADTFMPTGNSIPAPSFPANATGVISGGGAGDVLEKSMGPTPLPSPAHGFASLQGQITAPAGFSLQEILIAFFIGGCLVIAVLIILDICQQQRK